MAREQDQRITEVVAREQSRLRNFIRRRVPDPLDVEDILQEPARRDAQAHARTYAGALRKHVARGAPAFPAAHA